MLKSPFLKNMDCHTHLNMPGPGHWVSTGESPILKSAPVTGGPTPSQGYPQEGASGIHMVLIFLA